MLCTNGVITGWGDNQSGQLGSGPSFLAIPTPVSVVLPKPAVKVVATFQSSFAILTDGTLWAWGGNDFGQLGVGSGITSTTTAMQVPNISHVVAVAGFLYHTIALCADGTVWSWGDNRFGTLGTGATGPVYIPQQIPPSALSNIRAIASDAVVCMALDANGHIWSWGQDNAGELGTGLPVNGNTVQSAPTQLPLDNVRQIDASYLRAVALCTDGTVWTWGENTAGHLGLGLNNIAYTNKPTQVGAGLITDAVWVAINMSVTMAVRPNGDTYVWGDNTYGGWGIAKPGFAQVPIPGPTFSPNAQLDGDAHMFTSTERTGTVKTWGLFPLGYAPAAPLPAGGSDVPTTPTGMPLAVPAADFPTSGPLRAYYLNPAATYVAAQHGYTVSPAEVGTFGLLTVVDASRPPYNGTVVFDGVYHLRGDVQFINGRFEARPGTVFYVNGLSGRPTDSQRTVLEAQHGTLLLTNTEFKAQDDEPWQGIALTQGTELRTFGAGKYQRQHSIIRDAWVGVYNTADSHYYLYATDFINNGVSVMDAPRTDVRAGEGAQACRFVCDPAAGGPIVVAGYAFTGTGLYFYDTAETNAQNYYGDFGNAVFADNTFTGLRVGIYGTAGNAYIRTSSFANCW